MTIRVVQNISAITAVIGQADFSTNDQVDRDVVLQHSDIRMGKQAVLQDFFSAEGITAVNDRHILAVVGQV